MMHKYIGTFQSNSWITSYWSHNHVFCSRGVWDPHFRSTSIPESPLSPLLPPVLGEAPMAPVSFAVVGFVPFLDSACGSPRFLDDPGWLCNGSVEQCGVGLKESCDALGSGESCDGGRVKSTEGSRFWYTGFGRDLLLLGRGSTGREDSRQGAVGVFWLCGVAGTDVDTRPNPARPLEVAPVSLSLLCPAARLPLLCELAVSRELFPLSRKCLLPMSIRDSGLKILSSGSCCWFSGLWERGASYWYSWVNSSTLSVAADAATTPSANCASSVCSNASNEWALPVMLASLSRLNPDLDTPSGSRSASPLSNSSVELGELGSKYLIGESTVRNLLVG